MRARLYELTNRFEDPFGDVQASNSIGERRYLSRGKTGNSRPSP
jgi:hypothetical protein